MLRNTLIGMGILIAVFAMAALGYHFFRPRYSILEEVEEQTPIIIDNLN